KAGSEKPVEEYLRLVPRAERPQLGRLLADVLEAHGPGPAPAAGAGESEGYWRAAAVVDTVLESRGPSGVLPGALKAIRNARGIERESVVERLASDFGVEGEDGRRTLARNYHRLETGSLLGSKLSRRLLDSLAAIFDLAPAELAAAARPAKKSAPLRSVPAMGRGAGPHPPAPARSRSQTRSRTRTRDASLDDPEVELVEQLFHGGRDA
ncbi:MAG TPA: hypothetical protein VEB65_06630, partial [Solirubrobacterales bacterium]|nr:hypothetical protein [Solirubrobacterales bacterium]